MPRNIYTTPEAETSAYHRHVGARKPPSMRNKGGSGIRWVILAAVLLGFLIAWWLTGS